MVNFLIVSSGYNCHRFIGPCVRSVLKQSHVNFKAVFINDGSTDNGVTAHVLDQCAEEFGADPRFIFHNYSNNMGAAYRRLHAIREYATDHETVILLLGLDDALKPFCLERVAKEYEEGGKWMTYGNWVNQKGKGLPESFDLEFPDDIHHLQRYRKVLYRSTAPNTFYRFLFDRIPENDFKVKGKWIDSTTESELMFSCLEMCGKERIGIIRDPIYIYNEGLPGGTLKRLGRKYKYDIYEQIIKRPPKPLLMNKPTKEEWSKAVNNLLERRKTGVTDNRKCEPIIGDYGRHLRSVHLGPNILDVGCGDKNIERQLIAGLSGIHAGRTFNYTGIDAFPVDETVIKMEAEDMKKFRDKQFHTVLCFAVLDGCQDLDKATSEMKRVASDNVVFLTGVDIEPDEFHTFKIGEKQLDKLMSPFRVKMRNYLSEKVMLVEYVRDKK